MGASRNWLLSGAVALAMGISTSLPANVIYNEDFETGTSLEDMGFTTIDVGGTAEFPFQPVWLLRGPGDTAPAPQRGATSRVAQIYFDANNPLDDYLITPALNLEGGKSYQFFYTVSGGGNAVSDEMDVYLFEGPVPDPDNAIDIQIFGELITSYDFFDATELRAANTPRNEELSLTPTTTGTYHIAFYARSFPDQFFIWIDDILIYDPLGPPLTTSPQFPANGATNVNQRTYVHFSANPTATNHTVFFSTVEADVAAGTAPKILDDAADVFFADPGTLAPNTTYYFRVDARNANGTTEGTVASFTTRPAAVAAGNIYFFENFDTTYLNPPVPPSNLGYPELPKGWDTLDVDGALSAIGVPIGWYISPNRPLSAPNAVQTRRNSDGGGPGGTNTANDDWLFFPQINTHPSLESVLDFNMRTRIATIDGAPTDDTVEVYWSTTGTDSTNPMDYQFQDTIVTSSDSYVTYRYNLPKGENVRFALRYISPDRSQMLVDDVQAQILAPPPTFALLGPANGATDVNLQTYIYSPADLNAENVELFISTTLSEVENTSIAPIARAIPGGWYFDPGNLAPSTTYHARLRTHNAFGSIDGPISSFTTRAAVTAEGGTFFYQNFDIGPHSIPNTTTNVGYPALPKGWDAFDGDGLTTRAGFAAPFYLFASPTASQRFTAPNGLWSRGSANGDSNDWVFLPPVETHPTLDTVFRFWARGGDSTIDEIADVRFSTNVNSTNPADYAGPANLLGTILIPGPDFLTFNLYEFVLPKGQNVRVAVNCYSSFASRFITDDYSISILSVPDGQSIVYPQNAATNINRQTYLYLPQDDDTDSYTVYFSANQAEVQDKTIAPILLNSTDVFYADPGTLAPNTTYYVRLVAKNEFGDSDGPVTSFTTRAVPTAGGQAFWAENFDQRHRHPRAATDLNIGYPALPKGWETVDVDQANTLANIVAGFYIETGVQSRSPTNSLWSRGLQGGATSNDWVFMPPIDTHPTLDTVVRIWARGGFSGTTEIGDVRYSTSTASINPAEYTNLLGTITTDPVAFSTYVAYDYVLPKGQSVRVAVNGRSEGGSRFVLDDISIFVSSPPPALSMLWPLNGDNEVAGNATFFYFPSNPDVSSYTVYLSAVEAQVLNKSIAPVISNLSGQLYGDPGNLTPGTTYYARLVTNNDSGSTDGPVISFTTLPTPTNVGDRYFIERFTPLHSYPNPATRVGYPPLPKNWVSVDVDGLPTLISGSWPAGFYVEQGSSAQNRSAPHSLWSRGINGGQSNDWVFLPPVNTHPELNTVVRIWARGGFSGVAEIGDVRTSSNTASINPADYTNLLGTIVTPPDGTSVTPNFSTYIAYDFVLPKGEAVRVAVNGRTFDGSRFILDDIEIYLDVASVAIPGDYNGDGVVNVADVTALANFLNGIGSIQGDEDFNSDGQFNEQDIIDLANSIVNP